MRRGLASWSLLLLLAAAWLPYLPAVRGPFLFDDRTAIVENDLVHGMQGVPAMVRFWEESDVSSRPLRYFSFAVDWTLGGGSPLVFHLTNLLLHAGCVLLLWRLVLALGLPASFALGAALLFAVHPLQTEAVAYISGRKDLLCTFFYLLALHMVLRGGRAVPGRRWLPYGLFYLCFGAASLAKEMALTMPLAVVLLDMGVARSWRPARALVRGRIFYVLLCTAGVLGIVHKVVLEPASRIPFAAHDVTNVRLLLETIAWHVRKALLPWPQLADLRGLFPRSLGGDHGWAAFWNGGGLAATLIGLLLLGLLGLWAWRARPGRRGPALAGLSFFLLALLPVANLVPLNEPAAEHFLYLPLAGLSLLLASLLMPRPERVRRGAPAVAWGAPRVVVVFLAGVTAHRAGVWSTREGLWHSVLAVNTGSERAYNNLGLALFEEGDLTGARDAWRAALTRGPEPSSRTAANLLSLERAAGNLEQAARVGDVALRTHPDDPLLLSLQGGLLLEMGQADQAVRLLDRVAGQPDGPALAAANWLRDRGIAHWQAGDAATGRRLLEQAAARRPDDPSILTNLGAVLLTLDRPAAADTVLARAVALPGASGMAHRNHAVALLRLGHPREASAALRQAAAAGCPVPPSLSAAVAAALTDTARATEGR